MLKIVHIIPNLKKGGAERLVLDICNEFSLREKFQIKLVTFSPHNDYANLSKNIDWIVIPSYFIPSLTKQPEINISQLQHFLENFKPDAIHTHLWETEIVCHRINYNRAKWVTHFHDNMPQLESHLIPLTKKEITNLYEKKIILKKYKNTNYNFICISKDTKNYAIKVLPKRLHPSILLLPNAINYEKFYSPVTFPNKTLKLINIGSFVNKKNQQLAINILAHIRQLGVEANLTLLGDGILKDHLISIANNLNVSNHVIFKGNVLDVEQHLMDADIYLHTATYEPFGLVILEAMASGIPVVTLDGGGNRDIIVNQRNGYILKKQDVSIFSSKIIELFKNKNLFREISKEGQITAMKYDIKLYINKLLDIYVDK